MLAFACNQAPVLEQEAYMTWMEDPKNEAIVEAKTDQLKISCQIMPADYILLREIGNELIEPDAISGRKQELEKSLQFKIALKGIDGTSIFDANEIDEAEEQRREEYLRVKTKEHISIKDEEGQPILPSITHLIRNYNMKPETEILVAFEKENISDQFDLIFQNQLIDTVDISFNYNLNEIATLSTTNNLEL